MAETMACCSSGVNYVLSAISTTQSLAMPQWAPSRSQQCPKPINKQ